MTTHSKLIQWIRHHKMLAVLAAMLLVIGACKAAELLTPAKELALVIGEPWTDMQARSTAEIGPVYEGRHWYRQPKQLSYMRFADHQYGFITPPAKFFTVGFDDKGNIDGVRMSPQVEPLPLQEALDIVLDLQNQWRKSGWELQDPIENPPYEDSTEWRKAIEQCTAYSTYWQVKNLYSIAIAIGCFKDDRHPDEKRYLTTMAIGKYIDYESDTDELRMNKK
jgi:hypothetical protein